jgi:hypothetical protein
MSLMEMWVQVMTGYVVMRQAKTQQRHLVGNACAEGGAACILHVHGLLSASDRRERQLTGHAIHPMSMC